MMNTSCQHCCFKTMTDKGEQTGCSIDRLQKFLEENVVLRWESKGGYYIIENRICNALRTNDWADKQFGDLEEVVRNEIKTQCDFIVIINKDKSMFDIIDTIESISKQELSPKTIRVVMASHIGVQPVMEILGDYLPNIPFFVDRVMKIDYSITDLIDIAVGKCEHVYYAVFNAGMLVPNMFLQDIDNAINGQLQRFCLLRPIDDQYNGLFVQRRLHHLLLGNRKKSIVDKVQIVVDEQKLPLMIRSIGDICSQMLV